MIKNLAYLFGVLFLVIGVLGFVPAASPGNMFLGYFAVNFAGNVFHIVVGVAALVAALGMCPFHWLNPKRFFQVFGVLYGVMAVWGFAVGMMPVLWVIANNMADSMMRTVVAAASLYLGFIHKE